MTEFNWNNQCDSFISDAERCIACSAPILKYPRHIQAIHTVHRQLVNMAEQECSPRSIHPPVNGKEITMDHSVSYISRLFHGSQLNWAALT